MKQFTPVIDRRTPSISRRRMLKQFGVGLAGLCLLGQSRQAWAARSNFVPAIVIGSGFGGAVAALRLGQAGIERRSRHSSLSTSVMAR